MHPTLPSPKRFFYRNKVDFDYSADRRLIRHEINTEKELNTDFTLGLHVPGNFYEVLDLQECRLHSELSIRLANGVRTFLRGQVCAPWNIRNYEGFLRYLILRTGEQRATAW